MPFTNKESIKFVFLFQATMFFLPFCCLSSSFSASPFQPFLPHPPRSPLPLFSHSIAAPLVVPSLLNSSCILPGASTFWELVQFPALAVDNACCLSCTEDKGPSVWKENVFSEKGPPGAPTAFCSSQSKALMA